MVTKRLICLAKSWRPGGLCIAGREIGYGRVGEWFRPVDVSNYEAIRPEDVVYGSGEELNLLDIFEVDLVKPVPAYHQQENWVFDRECKLSYLGKYNRNTLNAQCDGGGSLWQNGSNSSAGLNNRVPVVDTFGVQDSLRMIHVDRLKLTVYTDQHRDQKRLTGSFEYRNVPYTLQVKDVEYENRLDEKEIGDYQIRDRYLCISLAGEFQNYCYKLIAGIM